MVVGSGLIYAVIITMWAAYFIPMWLRRHEELSESRSVERFSRAMRILSRREPTPDRRYVVMPARPQEPNPVPRPRTRTTAPGSSYALSRPRATGRPGRRPTAQMVRRRRILVGLVLGSLVATVLAAFSLVPWWASAVMLALTAADVAHLRIQARRRRELARTRDSVRRRTRSRLRRFDSAERIVEARRALADKRAAAEAERQAAAAAAERAAREEAARRAAEAAGWEPVPVPLPTYVSKPMAPRPARGLDLGLGFPRARVEMSSVPLSGEGLDVSVRSPEPFDQNTFPVATEDDGVGDDALDALIERRRAVNE